MAAPDAPSLSPPTPAECAHPAPVLGVMAHEFAHYAGAQGPEGVRRTVTYYGPVIGGLPIEAWHCPPCGLLKLVYPDGRREERRLFPGRQAGLIAEATTRSPGTQHFGMQPRVSGLSAPLDLLTRIDAAPEPVGGRPAVASSINLPHLDPVTWTIVLVLSFVTAGLFVAGALAVSGWTTPDAEGPLVGVITASFGAAVVLLVGGAVWRATGPAVPLGASIGVTGRGSPELDGTTRLVVALFTLATAGLLAAGVLAVYDWTTPGVETPVLIVTTGCACAGALLLIGNGIVRRLRRR